MGKYRNEKTVVDGMTFDSKREARRYVYLKGLEHLGAIRNLRRQVPYVLIKGQKWADEHKHRDTKYIADFVYELDGETVVEDVKGFRTDAYKLKRELMKDRYGIEVQEI